MALDATLRACVRLIRNDPDFDVQTEGRADGWANDAASVRFVVLGVPRQGVDEQRFSLNGDGTLREMVRGNRTLRLQVTCDTNAQTWETLSTPLADDLVLGFQRTDVAALLEVENLGVPVCTEPRHVPYRDAHGDWRSASVFEAVFPWSARHVVPAAVTTDRIGQVEFAGTVDPDAHAIGPTTVSEP